MAIATARVRKSMASIMVAMLIMIVGLAVRIAWVQLINGPKLAEKARYQLQESKVLQSPRGTIFDRNGHELAISNLTKSLYVNPKQLNKDPAVLANEIAPILALSVEELTKSLASKESFVWIKRTLEPDAADRISALIKDENITGLQFVEESKRYYPNNCLAAQVLGFVGTDDVGLDGVEMTTDKSIKGVLSKQEIDTDNHGIPIFKSIWSFNPVKQGKSVALTIDSTIQFITEQCLDKALATTKAQSGTVIIMNPKTGEILAMASRPTYDPNHFGNYGENEWKNRAISVIYEPGSTFKTIVAAAALQEKLVTPEERFVDPGFVEVSGRRIQNWTGDSFGSVTFTDIIKYSINTGFVQVGMRLGSARLTQYVREFGFGHATGVELPGEEEGILFNPKDMRDSDLATMSIGQSIAVTPLQLLTAVSAIANNGVLLKPHIVKEFYNSDGTLATATPTEPVRQVIAPDTAAELTGLLEKEVSEGGGKYASVKGYRFAGKTGTAEKLREDGRGYEAGHYIASFVGFGPVEDCQVAAIVVLDDPRGDYYGGNIAAPVFRDIMIQVMRYLNIRPENGADLGSGLPAPQIDPIQQRAVQAAPKGKILVPSVLGKTIREAGDSLVGAGLSFIPVGTGVAVDQSIAPNTAVDPESEITVNFESR